MKKSTILAAIAAVMVSGMVPALAQEADTQMIAQVPSASAQVGGERIHQRFSLTDAQLEKLHALRTQYATANASKKAELKVLRMQLKDALGAVNVDKGAALSIQSKISAIQADLASSRVAMMADASTVFTPEQRQQMHHRFLMRGAMVGKHHGGKRFGGHRGGHGGFKK